MVLSTYEQISNHSLLSGHVLFLLELGRLLYDSRFHPIIVGLADLPLVGQSFAFLILPLFFEGLYVVNNFVQV